MYYYAETKKQTLPEVFNALKQEHGFAKGSKIRMPYSRYWVELVYVNKEWSQLMYEAGNKLPDKRFKELWIQFTYDVCNDCAVIYKCVSGETRPYAVVRKYMPE